MPKILLINPNTSGATTAVMVDIARSAAADMEIAGKTVSVGAGLITTEAQLAFAAGAVVGLLPEIEGERPDGVIVSAFGDPSLDLLRQQLTCPVIGIAEAGMLAAAEGRRRFAIATTTPDLIDAIRSKAEDYGLADRLTSIRITEGDLAETMAEPHLLRERLAAAVDRCVAEDGAEAVVIGGGPLAVAARDLAPVCAVPLIEPIPAAVARLRTLL